MRCKSFPVFIRNGNGAARVQVHTDVDLCGACAERVVQRAPRFVFKGHGGASGFENAHQHVNFVAVDERDEKIRLRVDGGKAYPLVRHQLRVSDAAAACEKLFERNVKVMKDDRIVDQPRRVCIAKANSNVSLERQG
jgi:hypothetical protein